MMCPTLSTESRVSRRAKYPLCAMEKLDIKSVMCLFYVLCAIAIYYKSAPLENLLHKCSQKSFISGFGGGYNDASLPLCLCVRSTPERDLPSHPSLNLGEKLQSGIELTHNFGELSAQKLSLCDSQWPKSCISHI